MRRLTYVWTAVGVLAAGCLYALPPWQYAFYPRCPVLALTGWQCPGCGMTRAFAALLHGHWAMSWQYNPLALLLLPVLAVYLGTSGWRGVRRGEWVLLRLPLPILAGLLGAVLLFGIERNLHLMVR
jgi:Protein of unknown function (DUF2752)